MARLITRAFLNHSLNTDRSFNLGPLRSFSSLHDLDKGSTSRLGYLLCSHHNSSKEIPLMTVRVNKNDHCIYGSVVYGPTNPTESISRELRIRVQLFAHNPS